MRDPHRGRWEELGKPILYAWHLGGIVAVLVDRGRESDDGDGGYKEDNLPAVTQSLLSILISIFTQSLQ